MSAERSRPPLRLAPATPGGEEPLAPSILPQVRERTRPISLSPVFIDRCRKAFHSLEFDGPSRVLGITSALYGDGKTSVAAGIATAIAADTSESTVLVECDLEHQSFNRVFGIEAAPGLAEWVDGQPLRTVRMTPLDNAQVVTAGAVGTDAARVFYQLSQGAQVDQLRRDFRNVVIDLPPMLSIAYSALACRLTDHLLVVARYGVTPIAHLEKVVHLVGRERVSGIVLNGYASRIPAWLRRVL